MRLADPLAVPSNGTHLRSISSLATAAPDLLADVTWPAATSCCPSCLSQDSTRRQRPQQARAKMTILRTMVSPSTRASLTPGTAKCPRWCPGTESNCLHTDFQSVALPVELPGRRFAVRSSNMGAVFSQAASRLQIGNPERVRSALRPPTRHRHLARFPLRGLRDLHLPHHTRSLRSRPRARPRQTVRSPQSRLRTTR